ncbi:hypothetical protein [Methanolapillus millepedarum]|uniref:Uncharacterized protein n=1 Tax=Methanolapillus millepedarum TaxID=3028296 RepID=A0AA96V504_9EURY|nr:hypothetical protein MsAc7_12220 [Methanosarcinaceae archaeon Ac7]
MNLKCVLCLFALMVLILVGSVYGCMTVYINKSKCADMTEQDFESIRQTVNQYGAAQGIENVPLIIQCQVTETNLLLNNTKHETTPENESNQQATQTNSFWQKILIFWQNWWNNLTE